MAANDNRHVIAVADPAALATAAAERVLARIRQISGRVAICLTGGSSPKQLYQLLATDAYRSRIPWQRVHWFIGDERFVPADDPLNNMGMARAIFLDRCAPAANIHPIPTATADPADPDRSAALYEQRTEIVLWRGCAGSCPAPVRSRADGRRPRRPYRVAVSRLSRARRDRALGRRRAQGQCRAVRAARHPHAARARLLPRNAVRGCGRRKACDLDARVRRREPARQPRAIHRRDGLAGGSGGASGEFSWAMDRPLARWW